MNAVPAMGLCAFGFFTPNMLGGVCFGAGLGITLFGIMYMFVHDGLVHRRFPVGPIADLPYLKRVAAAHTMHHADKWEGAPWGLFLGPQVRCEMLTFREDCVEWCLVSSQLRVRTHCVGCTDHKALWPAFCFN